MGLRFTIIRYFFLTLVISCSSLEKLDPTFTLGVPSHWGSIDPSNQHSAIADKILVNQFETLVTLDDNGNVIGLIAEKWEFSKDFKELKFWINTKKTFSDGTPVTAKAVAAAWTNSYNTNPTSFNKSSEDVFFYLKDFSSKKTYNTLPGLTINENELQLNFKKPFRTALVELSGSRFSVFKYNQKNQKIGSGNYTINEENNSTLSLKPHNPTSEKWKIEVVNETKVIDALSSNKINAFSGIISDQTAKIIQEDNNLKLQIENIASHSGIIVNGLKKHIFEDERNRLALQYLIWSGVQNNKISFDSSIFKTDFQVLAPIQLGRLESDEVRKNLEIGKKHVQALITKSRLKPIKFYYGSKGQIVFNYLKELGLVFDESSANIRDIKINFYELYYKTHDVDLLESVFSFQCGDPDGIYHLLGKHGAITNPMLQRSELSHKLEKARSIIDLKNIDKSYKTISETFLRTVPFIHLGYLSNVTVFKKNKFDNNINNLKILNKLKF